MIKLIFFLLLRGVVAGIFIVSGTEKLLSPYENFLYVIQNYQVLPWPGMERMVAHVFPWIELSLGVFLISGLWIRWVLLGLAASTATFIFIVSQAIIRNLPINSCGCFGDLVKVPLPVILTMDSLILISIFLMSYNRTQILRFSLDQYFDQNP